MKKARKASASRGDDILPLRDGHGINRFRARQLALAEAAIDQDRERRTVLVNAAESPLAWLARRKGRDGHALIEPVQFQAGERLRADFTRAQLGPRVTSNWDVTAAVGTARGAGTGMRDVADGAVAARQRVALALAAVGPEFSGLLLDVCCFLKGLEDVERERSWPARSGKVVLQLGLDRLARHYGYAQAARGPTRQPIRASRATAEALQLQETG